MSFILDLNNIKPITLEDLEPKKNNEQIADTDIKIEEIKNEIPEIKETKLEIPKKRIKKNPNSTSQPQQIASKSNLFLLSIKEAETLSGISSISIRKAIKAKEINYSLDNGKYKIDFNDLLTWCYLSTRRKNVFNTAGIGKFVNSWNIIID